MNEFTEAYRISMSWLIRMGFTEQEAAQLAALRLAYQMHRGAFM